MEWRKLATGGDIVGSETHPSLGRRLSISDDGKLLIVTDQNGFHTFSLIDGVG